ncbi:hypothetical protein [Saccharicrinis aurantiacus]|uniref:hypothetical protein n=1 Tax=Saccharicrinis aurantiacus TaxID=1849719 RepID=UPI0008392DC7|nr:hypothetical protein [Saccharicrinis aurantiacus]
MEKLIFYLFVYSLGIAIYIRRPGYVPLYAILLMVFSLPFIDLIFTGEIYSSGNNGYLGIWIITQVLRNFLFIICFIEIVKRGNIWQFRKVLFATGGLLVLLTFWTRLNYFPLRTVMGDIYYIITFLSFLVYVYLNNSLKSKNIIIMIIVIIIAEALVVIINLKGIYLFKMYYLPNLGNIPTYKISGTFHRFNAFSNFLTTIFLFISLTQFSDKLISKANYLLLTAVLGAMLVLSGSKASIIVFIVILLSGLLYIKRKNLVLYVPVLVLVFIGLMMMKNYIENINYSAVDAENSFQRIVYGFADVANDNHTTLSITEGLFEDLSLKNLFFGHALAPSVDYYNDIDVALLRADARVAYMLFQFGLLPVLAYVLFFYQVYAFTINKLRKKKHRLNIKVAYLCCLLYTFTEGGFFDLTMMMMTVLYSFYLYKRTEEALFKEFIKTISS